MIMDKCPECGRWSLSFELFQKKVRCYNCGYEKEVDVKKYLEQNDLMPKLSKSLVLESTAT